MFEWAERGTLRDLFQEDVRSSLTPDLVGDILRQLVGLTDALSAIHKLSIRHGDLKPENILIFDDTSQIGHWKIADLGSAKSHVDSTDMRPNRTTDTPYATLSYEPPEVFTEPQRPRSRLFDIWSMGCIALELIIWLLYGPRVLRQFFQCLNSPTRTRGPYWIHDIRTNSAEVHPTVIAFIRQIKADPECNIPSAIREILRIVEEHLLVVPLPYSRIARIPFRGEGISPDTHRDGLDSDTPELPTITVPTITVVSDDPVESQGVVKSLPEHSKFRGTAAQVHDALRFVEEGCRSGDIELLACPSRNEIFGSPPASTLQVGLENLRPRSRHRPQTSR